MSKTQTGAFFNEKWHQDHAIDIAAARRQHENAKALLLELQQVQSEPDSDFTDYGLERIITADEREEEDDAREMD